VVWLRPGLSIKPQSVYSRNVLTGTHGHRVAQRPTPNTLYGPWADQIRIAPLTAEGADKWWRVVRGEDVAPVAGDALSDILVGVQWLRQHSTS
jgi:hypothetical protein